MSGMIENEIKEYWTKENPPDNHVDYEYLGKQAHASRRANQALANGTIEKVNHCEVCGRESKTVMHHYKGYDNPFDVWWVCHWCNANIPNKLTASGKMHWSNKSLNHAKSFVKKKFKKTFGYWFGYREKQIEECCVCGIKDFVRNMVISETAYRLTDPMCQKCAGNLKEDQ